MLEITGKTTVGPPLVGLDTELAHGVSFAQVISLYGPIKSTGGHDPIESMSYCWWQPEIRRSPVKVGSLCHYLQGFLHPRWCRMSSINSIYLLIYHHLPSKINHSNVGKYTGLVPMGMRHGDATFVNFQWGGIESMPISGGHSCHMDSTQPNSPTKTIAIGKPSGE